MYFLPIYILILAGTIIIDYYAGIFIENASGARRKALLSVSLVANIGVLAVFKYYNFFVENINSVFTAAHISVSLPLLRILLPIGLSFHTFQAMSYTIEVYRGNYTAERHFGIYALYVMFYPQLVAGPIERPQNILYQFYIKHEFNYSEVTAGLRQMGWGLIKKSVIADRLALVVDPYFQHFSEHSAIEICVAVFLYAFQIYCDFSGYSEIALGTARVMGFKLLVNFDHPYRSKTVAEFWRRWHISLSTWFRDYLYIPLGGNRVPQWRIYLNTFIIFMVSGLWHGANWTFIVWGTLHGVYLCYEIATRKIRERLFASWPLYLRNAIGVIFTFIAVDLAWVFFRASRLHQALSILKRCTRVFAELVHAITHVGETVSKLLSANNYTIYGALLAILCLEVIHRIERDKPIYEIVGDKPVLMRWSIYIVTFVLIAYFGVYNSKQFIYFQF